MDPILYSGEANNESPEFFWGGAPN